jgi:hypothetical protein
MGPADITSFTIDEGNRTYDLVNAKLKYYHTIPVQFGQNPVEKEEEVQVFAEAVYSNPAVVLYSLGDQARNERFFIKKPGELSSELTYFKFRVSRDGKTLENENEFYKTQLAGFVSDCNVNVSDGMVYSQREIIKVLDKYSVCKGVAPATAPESGGGLVNGGLMAAMTGIPIVTGSETNIELSPVVGISLQFLSKKNFNNRFGLAEAGIITSKVTLAEGHVLPGRLYFSLYGGTFIGKGMFRRWCLQALQDSMASSTQAQEFPI